MVLQNVTLAISVLLLLGGSIEGFKYFNQSSILVFQDYPLAILILILNGFLFLLGYIKFSNIDFAKYWLISAAVLLLIQGVVFSTYDAYFGFGRSFEAFPFLAPVLLFHAGLVVWYIKEILKYGKKAL